MRPSDKQATLLTLLGVLALLSACGGGSGNDGSSPPAPPLPTVAPPPLPSPEPSPLNPPETETRTAVVLTTDFESSSLATFPLSDPAEALVDRVRLHGDAVARAFGNVVYVINRFGADNVQALDASNDYETMWQCSVGNGKNPHDLVASSASRGYVSLYDGGVAVVNLNPSPDCSDFVEREIDLSSLADADGLAETDQMVLLDGRLYVSLQLLDRDNGFVATDSSTLAIIDTSTDELVGSIPLSAPNPFSETKGLAIDPDEGKILVAEVGRFGVLDGGIERIDPTTETAEGFFITEEDLGGDINDFVVVSDRRGYAIVSDADFNNSLVRFDPSTGTREAILVTGPAYLPDIEYDASTDLLFLATQDFETPGIRIFAGDDGEITRGPIDTGLNPFNICFVGQPSS